MKTNTYLRSDLWCFLKVFLRRVFFRLVFFLEIIRFSPGNEGLFYGGKAGELWRSTWVALPVTSLTVMGNFTCLRSYLLIHADEERKGFVRPLVWPQAISQIVRKVDPLRIVLVLVVGIVYAVYVSVRLCCVRLCRHPLPTACGSSCRPVG